MNRVTKCVVALLLMATAAAFGAARAGDADRVLYVYTWDNYFDPQVVRAFEVAQRCRVDFDYFDSYDTMYERIRDGGSGYDIITPPSNLAEEMNDHGLLMNLNRRLIPNMRHLDTSLLTPFPDLEMRYHAPYTWSIIGIGYNKKMVAPEALGGWDVFGRPGFEKRAAMMNEPRAVIGAALKSLGYSLNSAEPGEIRMAGDLLARWKKSIFRYGISTPRRALENGELAFIQAFSGDMAASIGKHPDLGFFVPREGSILNSDCFVIPTDAENRDLAHAFINHMFDPKMAARNMESVLYYMPNRAAVAQLSAEFKNHPFLFFPREDIERSEAIRNAASASSVYEEVWESLLIGSE